MWSPPTRPCGWAVVGPGALKALKACWVVLLLVGDWVIEGCSKLRSGLLGMLCAPWNSLLCTARTRFHVISIGSCILLILWLTVCVRTWSRGFTFPHGYTNAIGFSWTCGEAVTDDGTGPQPSSSCTKAGRCCMQPTAFWSFSKPTGLMKSLAGLCSMFFASAVILNLMNWTRTSCEQTLWLFAGRPLLGAYKLLRPVGPGGLKHMEMQQALWACFLPGLLSITVLSSSIRVIGCSVSQAAQCSTPSQDASMCPLQLYPATDRAFCTVWLIARQHLIEQAPTWVRTHACLWFSRQFHVGWAQGATVNKAATWAMVERLAESSSGEYLDLLEGVEDEMAEDGVPAAPPAPARVIRDRLGQIVRSHQDPLLDTRTEHGDEQMMPGRSMTPARRMRPGMMVPGYWVALMGHLHRTRPFFRRSSPSRCSSQPLLRRPLL